MGESGGPTMAPLNVAALRGEERWRHFDDSVNAVSFGFVATAILISMFLAMAIFERFLRPRSPLLFSSDNGQRGGGGPISAFQRGTLLSADLEAQPQGFAGKLDYPSPKMSIYSKEVPVLMPGHSVPTFIANPAPVPCRPERIPWPSHQQYSISGSPSNLG
ncbi:unnamed protein product [Musa acuminata subsp. burmannicoides]